ncbi:MAG: bacteriocin family protein [Euryarchaeota archaeon]|nr:bacteriocin family protein [Euryarchaeota archaeon]
MDLLKRNIAPVTPDAWEQIDQEAKSVFQVYLAARKLVDFDGPHGWKYSAYNTGRLALFDKDRVKGVKGGLRQVQPLVEFRTPIVMPMLELDYIARGAEAHLEPVAEAAKRIALAEDSAIFNGHPEAGIKGLVDSSSHKPVRLPKDGTGYPDSIAEAAGKLREAGVAGPYALALGVKEYNQLARVAGEGGYPIRKHIERQIVDGPIVMAPGLEGGLLLSQRGGDFILTVGQDLSVGYAYHDKDQVEFYITESFTFRVLEPDAVVQLSAK